jgi:ABC-type lipoprotein export system ATPase subunit
VAALRGLSLTVAAGETLVVHGPNGSGKTTLLRALVGEQRLAAGHAVVAGLDLAGAGSRQLAHWRASQLGQMDQDARQLLRAEFDVLDNVALQLRVAGQSRAQARERAVATLAELGLADLADRRPGTLSGGQRQRVAVCAALAHRPQLVLADEPTGELDLESADAVYELLASAVKSAGASLVLVTHDRRAGDIADRVVRIRDGRISETWRPVTHLDMKTAGESLVVDDRGWVRLPQRLRDQLNLGAELSAEPADGALILRPTAQPITSPSPTPQATAEPFHPAVPTVPTGPADLGEVVIEVKGVAVAYQGRPALGATGGVDVSVSTGELVVVAGRSGAGKSTLLRVLLGLQRPDTGQVRLAGADLAGLNRDQLAALRRECSAVVMQQIHLASTVDAAGNLELARAARGLSANPGLVAAQLARLGLTGLAHRQVSGLSGGERQRLAVARALVVAPTLIVLDEPTSQLDEVSAQMMTDVLRDLADTGTAVLAASHDPVLIAAASRTYQLS